jgi:hypothetical protein
MGFGRRLRGWRRFGASVAPSQPNDPGNERQALKNQAEGLKSEMAAIQKRLDDLDKTSAR